MISNPKPKLALFLRGLLVGAGASAFTMAICNLMAGIDRAGHLADLLHLGNGILLAALLGGATGAWLALGGRRRMAGFMGLILGVLAGWAAWLAGAPYVWMIDVILKSSFGDGAQVFTGFVIFAILFLVIRWVRAACESLLLRALSPSAPAAKPLDVPSA